MESNERVLTRARDGMITGTLKGLADYYGLKLDALRLFFTITAFFGIGVVAYFVLWVCLPSYSQRNILISSKRSSKAQR